MGQVIQIDEARIRDHLGEMVRGTVEETLSAMLDAEAGQLCGAQPSSGGHPGRQLRSDAVNQRRRSKPQTFQSCGARPSRLRSLNGTAAGRVRWRKH